MSRRWSAGWLERVDGVDFRVVAGRKSPDDLRLEWRTSNGVWVPPTFKPAFLMADFFWENEEVLYPNDEGGDYFWRYLLHAAKKGGWCKAWVGVEAAKAAKATRLFV